MVNSPLNLQGKPPGSNIMELPQLGGMTFSVTNNAGWYDVLVFTQSNNSEAPLDISSIDFHGELRSSIGDANNWLDMKTNVAQAQLVNGGVNGQLFFSVDVTLMALLKPGRYVMDMLAIDQVSGMVKNLCEQTPILVTVIQGITR